MARSRATAKKAGTLFESQVAQYLTDNLGIPVRRLPKSGARDVGDLTGVTRGGVPVVLECKNPGKTSAWSTSGWWSETEIEAENAGTPMGVLVISRHGSGVASSLVMVSESIWKAMDADEVMSAVEIKATGTSTWNPEPGQALSIPRRGRSDRWMAFLLSDLHLLVDTIDQALTASITASQADALRAGEKISATCSDGSQIVLMGLGQDASASDEPPTPA